MAFIFLLIMKKELRVRKNEEFSSIISKKHSLASGSFVIYYAKRAGDHARVGLSVSKKLGNAVVRNRIKRQVRMMFINDFDYSTCPYDLIVIIRNKYLEGDFAANRKDLEKLIKKVIIKKYEN